MFPSIMANDDYCSSVNEANFDRVVGLIDDARANGASVEAVAPDGESLPDRAYAQDRADDRARCRRPHADRQRGDLRSRLLVVRPYSESTDVIDYINERPAPLVAYWYGPITPISGPSSAIPAAAGSRN